MNELAFAVVLYAAAIPAPRAKVAFRRIMGLLRGWREHAHSRHRLCELDDHTLRDIGLIRTGAVARAMVVLEDGTVFRGRDLGTFGQTPRRHWRGLVASKGDRAAASAPSRARVRARKAPEILVVAACYVLARALSSLSASRLTI
jgi:uncharacterized protein YjiS (DUF1127 family)